ncbi:hypothetical protein OK016_16875 [Vibrio chagasii]|nr:hypothetical protein [Vibrio chagasii]
MPHFSARTRRKWRTAQQEDFNPFANTAQEAPAADFIKPTAILFNGGVLKTNLTATVFHNQRVVDQC